MAPSLRRTSAVLAFLLTLTVGLGTPLPRATAAGVRTATLVGTLQDELGCSADWQPSCPDTLLAQQPDSTLHRGTFAVPAGSWEYKIAIDKGWGESYGDGSGNARLVLAGPAEIEVTYDDESHSIALRPTKLAGPAGPQDEALAADSLREAQTKERFYFLMADRFANGSTANDAGGLSGGRLATGFDPTDKGFYHGGDLRGVVDKLDYIKGLGTTALWLTPSFKNRPVQGSGTDVSAGYHGYWITDFTQIDPHLGTNADMKALIAAAHAKGMRVYFDIITNHTADVIRYQENKYTYVPTSTEPYTDADGKPFDAAKVAGKDSFPELDLDSFPYTPVYATRSDAALRVPGWLNDRTMYHNRGDSTWTGESTTFGDFVGLDDLFTERPDVVDGMGDIYSTWVDFGVDGFRIDTVKHVNLEFWQEFVPRIMKRAESNGNDKFFTFGEVFDSDPRNMSPYTTSGKLPATLDFGFQSTAANAVQGKPTTTLRDFYAMDDWYTDTDSNAYQLPTFLGNHDMGRLGMMLAKAGHTGADLLARTRLAHQLMYLTRGNPVTYYGDEQGFAGAGGDKDARQDMFGTKVAQYASEPLVGGGTVGTGAHYNTSAPLYRTIAELSKLRQEHPTLADGAQIHRYASKAAGVYAFSRVDRATGIEYVVAINTAASSRTAGFQTFTRSNGFAPVYGTSRSLSSGKDARVSVTLPALSVGVWRARRPLPARRAAPAIHLSSPAPGAVVGGRTEIAASVRENTFAQVSFAYRGVGTSRWTPLGTDDNAPYRVFPDLSALPSGQLIEIRAVVKDASGNVQAASSYAIAGTPKPAGTPDPGDVGPVDLTRAKAIWVDRDTLAWPASAIPAGVDPAALSWRLHWSRSGTLGVDAESLVADDMGQADLVRDPAGLSAATLRAHPQLKGSLALRLAGTTARQVPTILTGQAAVALYDDTGGLIDASGVQVPLVLDALYAKAAAAHRLGASVAASGVTFRLWAPTAQKVTLLTWPAGASATAPVAQAKRVPMKRDASGTWTGSENRLAENRRYAYEVTVFAPTTGRVETNLVTDPYSVALTLNSTRSVAVDLADRAWAPRQWAQTPSPTLDRPVDSTIYELHVRDFSVADAAVPAAHRGTYLAFADPGNGAKHLSTLAQAGLNTVHLLPTFDIATIEEDKSKQATPPCRLASYPPDSTEQQACIAKTADSDAFNWGYDPLHYLAPEGSYASSHAAADGGRRVAEFRTMVGALHASGLRVVLDQVYNHTAASGQADKSVLDRIVPGYYQRLDPTGAVYTSTCCANVATEHAMAGKLMVDSTVSWAKHYKVDGFRFDLMGHHSVANMRAVRAALDRLTTARDGVDGKSVYLYGEGWDFGEVAKNALFTQAKQGQLGGTGIGTFSDRLRDAVRGGGPFDEDPRRQGFGSGEATDPNGAPVNAAAAKSLQHDTDLVQLGLAGNLKDFAFRSTSGAPVTGAQVDYNGSPAGYAEQPSEVVTYVDAHDNETLWDALTLKLPAATAMADRVRMNTVSLSTTALAQTPSFWHAGADLLRSKSLDRNSYNSGDWFNTLDWTGADNGFGRGLPPKADNEAKYSYQAPLLANPALKPARADVLAATAQAQDLLKLRFSTPLFRLGSAEAIKAKVGYPVSGTAWERQGVIVQRIDDTRGADADPALKGVIVVYNAAPRPVAQRVPEAAGANYALSPVQANGSDAVVKRSSFDATDGTFTVPGRTVAVFVLR